MPTTAVLRRVRLPLVGIISAGFPTDNDLWTGESCYVRLPRGARARDFFVVRARGESLIEVGIHDGDYVVCKRSNEARAGQLAAVLTPDGVTLKHVFYERQTVSLVPGNKAFRTLRYHAADLLVQGIVVSVERDP